MLLVQGALLPPAKLAVIPLGVVPCTGGRHGNPWACLEHIPHSVKRNSIRWNHAEFARQDSHNTSYAVRSAQHSTLTPVPFPNFPLLFSVSKRML
jgi:hypothetical protein